MDQQPRRQRLARLASENPGALSLSGWQSLKSGVILAAGYGVAGRGGCSERV